MDPWLSRQRPPQRSCQVSNTASHCFFFLKLLTSTVYFSILESKLTPELVFLAIESEHMFSMLVPINYTPVAGL